MVVYWEGGLFAEDPMKKGSEGASGEEEGRVAETADGGGQGFSFAEGFDECDKRVDEGDER